MLILAVLVQIQSKRLTDCGLREKFVLKRTPVPQTIP